MSYESPRILGGCSSRHLYLEDELANLQSQINILEALMESRFKELKKLILELKPTKKTKKRKKDDD